jgi:uncharacterized protein YkwD
LKKKRWAAAWLVLGTLGLAVSLARAQSGFNPAAQTPGLWSDEAQTVYLGNLARRDNQLPPLRWNLQMTQAARWFSWDSTENRPPGFCNHKDTLNRWPADRGLVFGYKGGVWGENAYCGYISPEDAITGWLNSPGHRENLLHSGWREIGLGYYVGGGGRGYVTQDFGSDPVYAPVIIENEAPSTVSRNVDLYIYDRDSGGGWKGGGPATQMQVSNDACFNGVSPQPYQPEKQAWTLAAGPDGWRTVYVRTTDALNRTLTASDSIYLGAAAPAEQMGAAQLSSTRPDVTLYDLDGGGLPLAQFSPGWAVDDTSENFKLWWGPGERVTGQADAWGGSAFRLGPPGTDGESYAWVWTTDFYRNVPLVAYVRLKVNDNKSPAEVARFAATGGKTLSIKGTDFKAENQYQEFPLAFTFSSRETFLTFGFWRSGSAEVYVDAVTLFSAPQSFQPTQTWAVPGGNYRGQGIWVRYTDGAGHFSEMQMATTLQPELSAAPADLSFMVPASSGAFTSSFVVNHTCSLMSWQVSSDSAWISAQALDDRVELRIDPSGLANGIHQATLTLSAVGNSVVQPVAVPVTLIRVEQVNHLYLPFATRP